MRSEIYSPFLHRRNKSSASRRPRINESPEGKRLLRVATPRIALAQTDAVNLNKLIIRITARIRLTKFDVQRERQTRDFLAVNRILAFAHMLCSDIKARTSRYEQDGAINGVARGRSCN